MLRSVCGNLAQQALHNFLVGISLAAQVAAEQVLVKVLDLADLTVDGTMATGGAVCLVLMTHGVNLWIALLCAFLAGMLAGLVTGILHTFMGIPAILAGILTQLALFSINLRIMGSKANVAINPDNYTLLVSLRNVKKLIPQNPILVVAVFTVVVIALLYWFFGTELGCSIRATGANANMSRAQGINVDFNKVLGLMISNGLVALASALYCQYQGFADVNAGRGAIVIGLAAVIIGEVVFSRIFRNFALRLLGVALPLILMLMVTKLNDLANACVEVLHVPYRYAFTFTTALRFVPVFGQEMNAIMEAQTARGVEYDTKNPIKKLKLMLPLCVPLLISSVGKTDSTALAAEQRGFYLRTRASSYKRYPIKGLDVAILIVSIALIVFGFLF